jgi:hypothetical protein
MLELRKMVLVMVGPRLHREDNDDDDDDDRVPPKFPGMDFHRKRR